VFDIQRDGSFTYYPNGSYSHLRVGEEAIESFTYNEAFNGGATVTIKIHGQTADDPQFIAVGPLAVREYHRSTVAIVIHEDSPVTSATYALPQDANGRFAIDGQGRISVIDPHRLDYEQTPSHIIEAEVRDGAEDRRFILQIDILDVTPEDVRGSSANDTFYGGDLRDKLNGGPGDDVLRGGIGIDWLTGGPGADKFVYGGLGDFERNGPDVFTDWQAVDKLGLGLLDANRGLRGNQDFTFIGLGTADSRVGQGRLKYYREGNWTWVVGNVSPDVVGDFRIRLPGFHELTADNFVGVANVMLTGTDERDFMKGTIGNDVLIGGLGADVLSGFEGSDTFVLRRAAESPYGPARDLIADWDEADRIGLGSFDTDSRVPGRQGFTFVGRAEWNNPNVPKGRITYFWAGDTTYVSGGSDDDPAADFLIQIRGRHVLTAANFRGLN
jgi:Ca2+-binding RTX toxin-like protein